MYKKIIEKLLSFPQLKNVKVNFDLRKRTLSLTAPIFTSKNLPEKVKEYVMARQNQTFKPHATSYIIEGNKVLLRQEIPFRQDFQATSKEDVNQFLQLSKHCHQMLKEIAVESSPDLFLNLFK